MNQIQRRVVGILLLFILLVLHYGMAAADYQQIELKAGWNLISFAVKPSDANVENVLEEIINNGILISIWTYDTASDIWSTWSRSKFPDLPSIVPAITHIDVGKGYWLKVTSATILTIEGESETAPGDIAFVTGWNLAGFSTNEVKAYDRVFYNTPVHQIWTYDAATGRFKGVKLPAIPGPPLREEFTQLEPGRGYWVKANEPFTLKPVLGTAMEGDKDFPPLISNVEYGDRPVWSEFTPGDEDIGIDGYYDQPETQRALTFRDNMRFQNIYISNEGTGILNWSASVDDAHNNTWLKFTVWDENEGKDILIESVSGSVTTDTATIKATVDRTGLVPGDYYASVTIASNGDEDDDPVRQISVHMNVATIEGDYKVLVKLDTVNGKKADMHNPRLFLSIYTDRDGLKGIIDEEKTLLMPQRFYMTGQYYEENTNHFIISGSHELSEDHADNPYQVTLRRDITLIGDRCGAGDVQLGPLDLKGEYRETIRNVLKNPIYLAGTFTATRLGNQPTTIDSGEGKGNGGFIPDYGILFQREITINERMIITDVDVTVNLIHTRPADLVVSLSSPTGTVVVLRDQSEAIVGEVTYDIDAIPVDSLDHFNGEMSDGVWTLMIEDLAPGEEGSLSSWSLNIKGTSVYSLSGTIAGAGEGSTVLLTGCGLSLITETDSDGSYLFDDLVNCVYKITAIENGYENLSQEVTINGQDQDLIDISLEKVAAANADFTFAPVSGHIPLIVTFTDTSPPEIFEPDHTYDYIWILNKMVDGSPESYAIVEGSRSKISHTFDQKGTYVAKMYILDQTDTNMPIITVNKPAQYITVGPSATPDGALTIDSYTTAGGGGWFAPGETGWYQEQENAFDSATFDIDRPPYDMENPGNEDTNAFLGNPDQITKTNQIGINGKIDGPAGENSMHIYVNMGQPIIGRSVSGNKILSIGVNP